MLCRENFSPQTPLPIQIKIKGIRLRQYCAMMMRVPLQNFATAKKEKRTTAMSIKKSRYLLNRYLIVIKKQKLRIDDLS